MIEVPATRVWFAYLADFGQQVPCSRGNAVQLGEVQVLRWEQTYNDPAAP